MKIGDVAQRTGLSAHTIRYYERIGLIPYADRDSSRHRDYDLSILAWIEFIGRLKFTGMPLKQMVEYARLRDQGPETGSARRELLEKHRDRVRTNIADLSESLIALDFKIAGYAGAEQRITIHEQNRTTRKPLRTR